jgi:hypothetical protein
MASMLAVCIHSLVSEEDTFHWLSRGDLKGETANEKTAGQHYAIQTKNHDDKNTINRNRSQMQTL